MNKNKKVSLALSEYSQEGAEILLRKTTCKNYHMGCVLVDCTNCPNKDYIGFVRRKEEDNANQSNAK